MTWIVVKQYFLTGSQDPEWATKQQFWSQLSGSGDTQTFRLKTNKRPGKKQLNYKTKIVQVVDIKQLNNKELQNG